MPKSKKGILRKEIIHVDGKEIEVDTFEATLILGSGTELETIDELLQQEEAEKAIRDALGNIETIAAKYAGKVRDIWYYYNVGKILQFVDSKGFTDRSKYRVWQRMAHDLHPELFGGIRKNAREATRYPEIMYHLGKQLEENVGRATFAQWYEILKFKDIYKGKDPLEQILTACEKGLSGVQLRQRIKDLRASKGKTK